MGISMMMVAGGVVVFIVMALIRCAEAGDEDGESGGARK